MSSSSVHSGRAIRTLEWVGAVAFVSSTGYASLTVHDWLHVAAVAHSARSIALAGSLGIVLGWLAADALSGVVHYLADNWGSPSWPVVGPAFIQPFRDHHVRPETILEHGFLERNGNSALIATLPLLPLAFASKLNHAIEHLGISPLVSVAAAAALMTVSTLIAITNEIHAWAHANHPPAVIRFLQRAGLILSPRAHARHHQPPFKSHYCITSGVVDRIYDHFTSR